ncbi:DMT family transporter [Hirschia maritima]|uniref:EamA family transporter n=1 Tax=Hirschia maritima TaxID=1121961 RepID=UPI00036D2CD3|nr:EamA family transporter [Hirschia maritima]
MLKFLSDYGLLVFTVLSLAAGQILFKVASGRLQGVGVSSFLNTNFLIIMVPALIVYAIATITWILVLRTMPLSTAYVFVALAFVIVPVASIFILRETVTPIQWAGFFLICAGVGLAGMSQLAK